MQNDKVNEGTIHFLGARIWVSMPVYWYENPSGYVIDVTYQQFFERYEQKGQLWSET